MQVIKNTKPCLIFTTFWDVQSLIERFEQTHRLFLEKGDNIYSFDANMIEMSKNSIALRQPEGMGFDELPLFFPTYEMLRNYKQDKNWEVYSAKYFNLIKARKVQIKKWLDSIINPQPHTNRIYTNRIYFLACWENTATGANCHRKLLYDILGSSKYVNDGFLLIYRHGNELMRERCLKNKKNMAEYSSDNDLEGIGTVLGGTVF